MVNLNYIIVRSTSDDAEKGDVPVVPPPFFRYAAPSPFGSLAPPHSFPPFFGPLPLSIHLHAILQFVSAFAMSSTYVQRFAT
jgi:hypothetical protein